MNIIIHRTVDRKIGEVQSDVLLVTNPEDGFQILIDLYYQDFDSIILYEENITPAFFDLKTGIAGEFLQKCSNYKIRLAIIGAFSKYSGQSIKDFIVESNRGKQVNFLASVELALEKLSG